jgi:hypothetical protein
MTEWNRVASLAALGVQRVSLAGEFLLLGQVFLARH